MVAPDGVLVSLLFWSILQIPCCLSHLWSVFLVCVWILLNGVSKDCFLSWVHLIDQTLKSHPHSLVQSVISPTTVGFSHLRNLVPLVSRNRTCRSLSQDEHGVNHVVKPMKLLLISVFKFSFSNFTVDFNVGSFFLFLLCCFISGVF